MREVDLVVIGSGPGGEGAAMQASKKGLSVAVVERHVAIGGGCTHWGTIPSKALRFKVREVMKFRRTPAFRDAARRMRFSFPDFLRDAESVIREQVDMRQGFYERNEVDVFEGFARFVERDLIEVVHEGVVVEELKAKAVVIATGSRPYHPPFVDFSHPLIRDANTILDLDFTPKSITIYGAGVIGCEYASIFRNLDVKVNLINTWHQLLAFLDDEIVHALSYHLREQGVVIRHDEQFDSLEVTDEETLLRLKSGKLIKGDVLLWANGRTGNTQNMGLEALGLQVDSRGNLAVDENYQTAVPGIYAVGDVIGQPALASAAYDEGRYAARFIASGGTEGRPNKLVPTGIYTSPEISSLGATEQELTELKVPYEVGVASFKSLARAQITGQTVGMLKLLFHRDTLEILGIHCFGDQAAEIIHIGQVAMSVGGGANNIAFFTNTTFNYPTMAEAYRVAALNGLNRL